MRSEDFHDVALEVTNKPLMGLSHAEVESNAARDHSEDEENADDRETSRTIIFKVVSSYLTPIHRTKSPGQR